MAIFSSVFVARSIRLFAPVLLAVSLDAAQLSLTWADNSDNESGFRIERSTDGTNFGPIATVGANVTGFVDDGLEIGTVYWYRVQAYNAAGASAYTNVASASTPMILAGPDDVIVDADGQFHSTAMASSQTGMFTLAFDATPSAHGIDSVIGLSSGLASSFSDLAAIVRFNSSGGIDARNGSSYGADTTIPYTAGVTYTFRVRVNLAAHTYSVYVTAAGGMEQTVGTDFAFRTEQSDVLSLDTWSVRLSTSVPDATVAISGFELSAVGSLARLVNLSTRGVINGSQPMIAGFVVDGSTSQRILIRAVGNGLADFGVANPVSQPVISIVHSASGTTVAETSAGWDEAPNAAELAGAFEQTGAFALQEDRGDAALVLDLEPGLYSAVVRDATGTGGACLVEAYVVDGAGGVANLSTRGFASTGGGVMIAGLVVSGSEPKPVLIRGVGPALAGFGVADAMTDPQIAVYPQSGTEAVGVNDDWGDDGAAAQVAATAAAAGAFGFSSGSADAALVMDLEPGIYTVHLSPATGDSGTGLIEVYEVMP